MQTSILCRAPWTWAPLRRAFAQVLFLSPSLSRSLSFSLSLCLSLSHTTHTGALSLPLSLSISICFSLLLSHICFSLCLSHIWARSLFLSPSASLCVSLSLSLTHTRTARHTPSTPILLCRLCGILGIHMVEYEGLYEGSVRGFRGFGTRVYEGLSTRV